jgi:uncharacterized protein YjbI with pentapeptide repeats
LRDADATGADFSYSELRRADLSGAILKDAIFTGADMRGCIGCPAPARAPVKKREKSH